MNIAYLAKLAESRPALARGIEAAIAAALSYLLGALAEGKAFSLSGLVMAVTMPLYMAATKWKRDITKIEK